ncbi:MAG: hypothetical protein R2932_23575 [Caldilineaceae bacterium]
MAELDVTQLASGQPAAVEIDALSGQRFKEVTDIAPPATALRVSGTSCHHPLD